MKIDFNKIAIAKRLIVAFATILLLASMTSAQNAPAQAEPTIVIPLQRSDRKPEVIAIRRVNLLARDFLSDGSEYQSRIPWVEILLHVGPPEFNTQLIHIIRIGDTDFAVSEWTQGSEQDAVVRMTSDRFDELEDGGEISFRTGRFETREAAREFRLSGRPLLGLRIGVLKKSLIDLNPTLDKCPGWKSPPCTDW